jgi:ribose 5-phosphate isomerase A
MNTNTQTQQDLLKQKVGAAALAYIEEDMTIGVGSGSTVHAFIDQLATIAHKISGAVASSLDTAARLKAIGISVLDLNAAGEVQLTIDGADEISPDLALTKGGGGALTREKILIAASRKFICIADDSKKVGRLGVTFPIAVEVIPMARSYVARQIVILGGDPVYRQGFTTDNGNIILDIHNLSILTPIHMEETLNNITGVVTNGIFAQKRPNIALIASDSGIEVLTEQKTSV